MKSRLVSSAVSAALIGCAGEVSRVTDASVLSDGAAANGDASSPASASMQDAGTSLATNDLATSDLAKADLASAPQTLTVSISFPPATYTLGAATSPFTMAWSSAVPATCTPSPTNLQASTSTSATYATPTAPGSYTYALSCVAPAGYSAIAYAPASSSTTVATGTEPCSASQRSSSLGGVTLERQCVGIVQFNSSFVSDYGPGPVTEMSTVLGGGSFPSYISGYSPTFQIDSGSYVALQFDVVASGSIQFVANTSYGNGGLISMSTIDAPGALLTGQPGVICAYARGGANNLEASTSPGAACPVVVGQSYYINFADATVTGQPVCAGNQVGTCSTSNVAYTLYTSGTN